MASFTINAQDRFPEGTVVSALKHSNYSITQVPPTTNVGSVDATATVTNGVATLTGLADNTGYYATATVSGQFRVVSFRTPAVVQTQTVGAGSLTDLARDGLVPTGAIVQNMPRWAATSAALATTSGTMRVAGALVVPAGRTISRLTFVAGGTALSAGSNQWAALYSSALQLISVSNDDGANAWAGGASKTFTLTTPYTPQTDTLVVPTIVVVATTAPSLAGVALATGVAAVAPVYCGSSTAGLTNPASAPATAATPSGTAYPYCYAS